MSDMKLIDHILKMKRKPSHPGRILKNHHLKPLNLSITEVAEALQISRKTLSQIVNERASVTPDIALRLARAFNTTPDLWLGLQQNYDLWMAMHKSKTWKKVVPLPRMESEAAG